MTIIIGGHRGEHGFNNHNHAHHTLARWRDHDSVDDLRHIDKQSNDEPPVRRSAKVAVHSDGVVVAVRSDGVEAGKSDDVADRSDGVEVGRSDALGDMDDIHVQHAHVQHAHIQHAHIQHTHIREEGVLLGAMERILLEVEPSLGVLPGGEGWQRAQLQHRRGQLQQH